MAEGKARRPWWKRILIGLGVLLLLLGVAGGGFRAALVRLRERTLRRWRQLCAAAALLTIAGVSRLVLRSVTCHDRSELLISRLREKSHIASVEARVPCWRTCRARLLVAGLPLVRGRR